MCSERFSYQKYSKNIDFLIYFYIKHLLSNIGDINRFSIVLHEIAVVTENTF